MRRPSSGSMAAIRNADPFEYGIYVDGKRRANFIGRATNSEYRSPKDGGNPQWMLDMEFSLLVADRNNNGKPKEVTITFELPAEHYDDHDHWLRQKLGTEAEWDEDNVHDVLNAISAYSRDEHGFIVRDTTTWADPQGTWRNGKLVANLTGKVLRERALPVTGETVYDLRIEHNGQTKYISGVSFDALMIYGGWERAVAPTATIHDPVAFGGRILHEYQVRSDSDRKSLLVEALRAEQQAHHDRIAAEIAKLQ